MIENIDQRSKDYSEIRDKFRPGHADYTYEAKYGMRDYRGGGRHRRARPRCACRGRRGRAQDSARRAVRGALVQIGPHKIDRATWDWDEVGAQSVLLPGRRRPRCIWEEYLDGIAQGGLVGRRGDRGRRRGRARRAWARRSMASSMRTSPAALMSINAVKGVEIGAGFGAAELHRRRERRRDAHGQ